MQNLGIILVILHSILIIITPKAIAAPLVSSKQSFLFGLPLFPLP